MNIKLHAACDTMTRAPVTKRLGFETKRGTIDSQNNSFSSSTNCSVHSVSPGQFKESRRDRQICDVGVAICEDLSTPYKRVDLLLPFVLELFL